MEAGRQLGPGECEAAEEGEAGRAAGDSLLVGTPAAPSEDSAFGRWTWPGVAQMGANRLSADPLGIYPRGADRPGTYPPGAVCPSAGPPCVDRVGTDAPRAGPPVADLQVRLSGCSTNTSPCGVPATTGSDCGCWKRSETASEAAAASFFSSPFPCSSPRCLVRRFPSCRTSAPGSCATFGPIPRILSSGRWPAERPAFACACARLQV